MVAESCPKAKVYIHTVYSLTTTKRKTMKLTTEQKLERAIAFIKSMQSLDKSKYDTFDLSDLERSAVGVCDECGSDVDVKLRWPYSINLSTEYIDYKVLDDLSDKAWHVLADLTD